jgi:hypothetical protein
MTLTCLSRAVQRSACVGSRGSGFLSRIAAAEARRKWGTWRTPGERPSRVTVSFHVFASTQAELRRATQSCNGTRLLYNAQHFLSEPRRVELQYKTAVRLQHMYSDATTTCLRALLCCRYFVRLVDQQE